MEPIRRTVSCLMKWWRELDRASDLEGADSGEASRILDLAAAADSPGRAVTVVTSELAKLGIDVTLPSDDDALVRLLHAIPEPDLTILCQYQHGMTTRQIAEVLDTDLESVRRSLARTYVDLRMGIAAESIRAAALH